MYISDQSILTFEDTLQVDIYIHNLYIYIYIFRISSLHNIFMLYLYAVYNLYIYIYIYMVICKLYVIIVTLFNSRIIYYMRTCLFNLDLFFPDKSYQHKNDTIINM